MDQDEIMTPNEVAKMLKLNLKTIYHLIKSGDIPAKQIGGSWRLSKKQVLDKITTTEG